MEHAQPKLLAQRSRFWGTLAVALFVILGGRLGWVQGVRHSHYVTEAQKTRGRRWPLPAPRGNVLDCKGTPLALNLKLFSVAADPSPRYMKDKAAVAKRLAPLLRLPEEDVLAKLSKPGARYVRLRDSVDEPVAKAIRGLDCAGLIVTEEWRRAYPHGSTAAGLVGFVGKDMRGLGGVERRFDTALAGITGETLVMLDGRLPRSRTEIPGTSVITKEMVPGSSVVLTIDMTLQAAADAALAKAVETYHARGGTAILMDPKTGDILALATQPSYDPNSYKEADPRALVAAAVASPYEPGSTFKSVTACAALEEGVMSHGETMVCSGTKQIGNRTIGCAQHGGSRAHGVVDLNKMIVKSCNVGLGTVALQLGPERLYEWVHKLGFGQRTGLELAGESPGQLTKPERWSQIQLANVGFGQGVSVTAVQLLRAYATIANGGTLVPPRLVKMITPPEGRPQYPARPKAERVLSAATCARMRQSLQGVVDEGTGEVAQIPGRTVAGKTGTAQKPTPEAGYRSGKYVGSFVGFAPVKDPRVACIVVIDEPTGSHYGGVVAAPAFREIVEKALSYYHVPPDAPMTKGKKGHGKAAAGGHSSAE